MTIKPKCRYTEGSPESLDCPRCYGKFDPFLALPHQDTVLQCKHCEGKVMVSVQQRVSIRAVPYQEPGQ